MPSSGRDAKANVSIANGKFVVDKKLGAGCFGEVWRGANVETKQEVAVKFEDVMSNAPQLEHEAAMLKLLRTPLPAQGFAEYFYFGREGNWNCMVMEYLGSSLQDKVEKSGGSFTVKTTVLVVEQILRRIEYLHSKGVIHRDIKPENFMFGAREKQHHLYLIDFGLSKRYWERRHVAMKMKLSLTGTARYASISAHKGNEQSRRDDLEAIGHMLLYFLRSSLPWSGLDAKNKQEKYRKIMQKKETVQLEDLCQGFPEAFKVYLEKCRNMGFKERPDYTKLRKLFRDVRARLERDEGKPIQDHDFQWNEGKDLGPLVPLGAWTTIQQPEENEGRRSRGLCCLCGSKNQAYD